MAGTIEVLIGLLVISGALVSAPGKLAQYLAGPGPDVEEPLVGPGSEEIECAVDGGPLEPQLPVVLSARSIPPRAGRDARAHRRIELPHGADDGSGRRAHPPAEATRGNALFGDTGSALGLRLAEVDGAEHSDDPPAAGGPLHRLRQSRGGVNLGAMEQRPAAAASSSDSIAAEAGRRAGRRRLRWAVAGSR